MNYPITLTDLQNAYQNGEDPAKIMAAIRTKCAEYSDRNIWVHLLTETEQQPYLEALAEKDPASSPLWGIPFAIKDNIDLANIATTAGCPEFAYTPTEHAHVVQQLIDAGAIPVGKTNLDQFATGLNGTRSPFGAARNAFDPDYISGGSSSGSAVAVSLGLATFSLGTDTAGSGRVPACLNNLVGLKPSIGLLSATGLVPACRSLDCISIFAYNTFDANQVLAVAEDFDARDGYSRKNPFANQARQFGTRQGPLTIGVIKPEQLQFFGNSDYQKAYEKTLEQVKAADINLVEFDYEPFAEAARLLYEGPWVAERFAAIEDLMTTNPDAVFPVVRTIVEQGATPLAKDLFKAQYRLKELIQICRPIIDSVDALLTPTNGTTFTVDQMLAEPIANNSAMGYYTNFVNLMDLSALAIPTQITEQGFPFGVTLVGRAFSDRQLLNIANRINAAATLPVGCNLTATSQPASPNTVKTNTIDVVVCGAHLDGLPLNWQLKERGATFVEATTTSASYLIYALAGGPPFRPGLIRNTESGKAIAVEIWSVPAQDFGSFVAGIPAPLGIGKVELADGRWLSGFICEPCGVEGAQDITELGGWRAYMAKK